MYSQLHRQRATRLFSIISLLGAVSYSSMGLAQDIVIDAGQSDTDGVVLTDGGSLANRGTISNTGDAVGYPGPGGGIDFIRNEANGSVTATGGWGIGINGNLGQFENAGTIFTDSNAALGVAGNLGTFVNTGSVTSTGGAGAGINGTVDTFDNNGTIQGIGWEAVRVAGGVNSFVNQQNGVIRNNDAAFGDGHGVGFNTDLTDGGAVARFENRGIIEGDLTSSDSWGVGFFDNSNADPNAFLNGSFTNSGTISAAGGVLSRGGFTSFANSGTISGITRAGVNSDGPVSTFTNSGLIEGGSWDALFLGSGVGSFSNTATGTIRNIDRMGNAGNGVAISTDLVNGGAVGSFDNAGTITGDIASGTGAGVGFFDDGNGAFQVGRFTNSGSINGRGNGVESHSAIETFVNSGSISSMLFAGVRLEGAVGSFANSGDITSEQDRGVDFLGDVTTFSNNGSIISLNNGVTFRSTFGAASNAGTIVSTAPNGQIGVRIDEAGGTFTNTGTIQGAAGVVYILNATGSNTFINSGTVEGTAGSAIIFDDGADGGNDTLVLQTGSKLFGDVYFGGGDDALVLSDFRGNALLRVFGLENLVPGSNLIFGNGPNEIGVVEPVGVTATGQLIAVDTATQIRNLISGKLSRSARQGTGDSMVLGYVPLLPAAPASAAIGDLEVVASNSFWVDVLAGGSADGGPVAMSNVFGGIVAGGHARVGDGNLGLLAGVTSGEVDINNGGQRITTTSAIAGIYGDMAVGVIDVDFSLLGGTAGNDSQRQVVTPAGTETAVGQYGSWFLSPSLGVALPVLETDVGELKVTASLSYVGGNAGGYTETGSVLNLVVGDQTISLLDARFGLAGEHDAASGVTFTGKAGLFAQSNMGGSSTPVTLFGQTQNAVTPGSTEWGVYAGGAMSADIGNGLAFTAGIDGQLRFDGLYSASARIGMSGSF